MKKIVRQIMITFYSDGTQRVSEIHRTVPERDSAGRFVRKPRKIKLEVTPDKMVQCPYCGYEFRIGHRLAANPLDLL